MHINPFIWLLITIISLYRDVVVVYIIFSWLISLNIVNPYQPFVNRAVYFLRQLTEPVLGRIRRYIPPVGGIDLSPIVLFIGLQFLMLLIENYL